MMIGIAMMVIVLLLRSRCRVLPLQKIMFVQLHNLLRHLHLQFRRVGGTAMKSLCKGNRQDMLQHLRMSIMFNRLVGMIAETKITPLSIGSRHRQMLGMMHAALQCVMHVVHPQEVGMRS